MSKRHTDNLSKASIERKPLFQGAIIDKDGNEITITDQMIQNACAALEKETRDIYQHEIAAHTGAFYSVINDQNPD